MEVEVKIRLFSLQGFEKVLALFKQLGNYKSCSDQTNLFFDTFEGLLETQKNVFRLRKSVNGNTIGWKLTFKGKATLENGVSRVEEIEDSVSQDAATVFLENGFLNSVKEAKSVVQTLQSRFPTVQWTTPFTKIGSFQTIRHKIEWENVLLEIDHTKYEFGDAFEIEAETNQPEQIKEKIITILKEHEIEYGFSKRNKFVNMKLKSIE